MRHQELETKACLKKLEASKNLRYKTNEAFLRPRLDATYGGGCPRSREHTLNIARALRVAPMPGTPISSGEKNKDEKQNKAKSTHTQPTAEESSLLL